MFADKTYPIEQFKNFKAYKKSFNLYAKGLCEIY